MYVPSGCVCPFAAVSISLPFPFLNPLPLPHRQPVYRRYQRPVVARGDLTQEVEGFDPYLCGDKCSFWHTPIIHLFKFAKSTEYLFSFYGKSGKMASIG
jgi:hypothetical protein